MGKKFKLAANDYSHFPFSPPFLSSFKIVPFACGTFCIKNVCGTKIPIKVAGRWDRDRHSGNFPRTLRRLSTS